MAMKILNQFIDDFVGVFQYRFMDTFQYFKERKKSKYLGDRFEEWVVKNSNISKDGYSDLYTFKIEVQLFRPLPRLRSVAEKAR